MTDPEQREALLGKTGEQRILDEAASRHRSREASGRIERDDSSVISWVAGVLFVAIAIGASLYFGGAGSP